MKVVNIKDVPVEEIPHVREGVFQTRRLLMGEPGTPGNFALQLVKTPESYYSPRHRHNFDQVRYQIEGDFDFTGDGKMSPGSIAYFPEGAHYGPQDSRESSLTLVLQFGGASGSGYISTEQYEQARQALSAVGTFEKGVFTREKPEGGKINQDAYEAVWEQVNGRPLEYPRKRYSRPVFIETGNFNWVPCKEHEGVSRKILGVFSECQVRIVQYQLEKGTSLPLEDNAIYFIESGTGKVDGEPFEKYATIHVKEGENSTVICDSVAVMLQLGLPYFN